ncbi:MAG: hypothetical protein DRG09_04320 [Epsilonproteobacteria bacterium]|nr:MAG: hypothetical protein DRG09_04320 [Campylobacterota bacterium]
MNNKKRLNKAIKSAREINEMVSLILDKTKIDYSSLENADKIINEYNKVIFAYLSIIIEHHRSIIELTNVRQLSALALMRPLYESYIRTVWLTSCISEKTVKASLQLFHELEDGKFPTLRTMCEDIDIIFNIKGNEENLNAFARELEVNKRLLHSYTHGGAHLIAIVNHHQDRYTYKEMMDVLKVINDYILGATQAYLGTLENVDLAEEVLAILWKKII